MGHSLLAFVTAAVIVSSDSSGQDLDLYTATLFHERLASICRENGLFAGYAGELNWTGWPVGAKLLDPNPAHFCAWDVTSNQTNPEARSNWILFKVTVSRQKQPEALAACVVNGKRLYIRVLHVHNNLTVDNPIPAWALNQKGKASRPTVRKFLQMLGDDLKAQIKFEGNKDDVEGIGLYALNLFHFRLCTVADEAPFLCVYYRGALGRHRLLGRGEFRLPETANPALTWTITNLDDTTDLDQHLVCQIRVSLTKQRDSIVIYSGNGKRLYLSVTSIAGRRTVDDKIQELSASPNHRPELSVREFLRKLQPEPSKPGK